MKCISYCRANENKVLDKMKFTDLGLSPKILKAIADKGYETPSPIQADAIPAVLKGFDVMAAAQTGTGKTAGFTLPILERLISNNRAESNRKPAINKKTYIQLEII